MQRRLDTFQRQYKVLTGAYIGKPQLDEGGKVLLPPSALDELAHLNVVYPMLFELINPSKSIHTHSGVLEFSAEEGYVYVPYWMMQHLQLQPGQMVVVRSTAIAKGKYVKIRPQSKKFIEISDPKAVLEAKLRNFSCLTKGDTIMINYNNTNYCIDIMEVASTKGPCPAISIVEADVEVDFDRPLDMPPSPKREEVPQFPIFGKSTGGGNQGTSSAPAQQNQAPAEETKPAFTAFVGSGRRLDGKSAPPQQSTSQQTTTTTATTTSTTASTTNTSQSTQPQQNKPAFVFGKQQKTEPTTQQKPKEEPQKEEPKFVPFGGQGRSLK